MSASSEFIPVNIAVLTVSDTRTVETDTSGQLLVDSLQAAGHQLADRALMKDDIYQVRAIISKWIASADVEAILITGGTGFSGRDTTPEAVMPLFDKQIEGYGELFRQISLNDIGTSTIQSRACAGVARGTYIFCLPGSTGAVKDGWDAILASQLDSRHRPCNFADLIPRLKER